MEDFSLINSKINFHEGCIVDILDDHSENYLIEFLEKDNYSKDWLLVKGYHGIPKYNFLVFSPKKFAVNWRVNIYGWENEKLKHLTQYTYTHYNKNILLHFKSDSIKEQKVWIDYLLEMVTKYNCNITVVSKDSSRLFSPNSKISIVNSPPQDYKINFDSSYVIGLTTQYSDFISTPDITYFPSEMRLNNANSGNYFENRSHKIDLTNADPKTIIKNILDI